MLDSDDTSGISAIKRRIQANKAQNTKQRQKFQQIYGIASSSNSAPPPPLVQVAPSQPKVKPPSAQDHKNALLDILGAQNTLPKKKNPKSVVSSNSSNSGKNQFLSSVQKKKTPPESVVSNSSDPKSAGDHKNALLGILGSSKKPKKFESKAPSFLNKSADPPLPPVNAASNLQGSFSRPTPRRLDELPQATLGYVKPVKKISQPNVFQNTIPKFQKQPSIPKFEKQPSPKMDKEPSPKFVKQPSIPRFEKPQEEIKRVTKVEETKWEPKVPSPVFVAPSMPKKEKKQKQMRPLETVADVRAIDKRASHIPQKKLADIKGMLAGGPFFGGNKPEKKEKKEEKPVEIELTAQEKIQKKENKVQAQSALNNLFAKPREVPKPAPVAVVQEVRDDFSDLFVDDRRQEEPEMFMPPPMPFISQIEKQKSLPPLPEKKKKSLPPLPVMVEERKKSLPPIPEKKQKKPKALPPLPEIVSAPVTQEYIEPVPQEYNAPVTQEYIEPVPQEYNAPVTQVYGAPPPVPQVYGAPPPVPMKTPRMMAPPPVPMKTPRMMAPQVEEMSLNAPPPVPPKQNRVIANPGKKAGGGRMNPRMTTREENLRQSIKGLKNLASYWQEFGETAKAKQEINPFSDAFKGERVVAQGNLLGSKSDQRAQDAQKWTDQEIERVVTVIRDFGQDVGGKTQITFKELFLIYEKISDTLVFMLLKAKKRGRIHFADKEMLLQGRDDDVVITVFDD